MSNAPTRAHVASPTASQTHIPAADPKITQLSTPEPDGNTLIPPTPPALSHKEKHLAKKFTTALPTPPTSDTDTPRAKPPNNPPKKPFVPPPMPPAPKNALQTAYPLLIASLGNPGKTYANTLHSAGHIVLTHLATRKSYTPFTKGLSGLVSVPDTTRMSFGILQGFRRVEGAPVSVDEDWTFWQSTSLMNVSGRGVGRAYTEWLRGIRQKYGDANIEGRLVVVHDELESALGKITIKDGAGSAKGHNGLKSCQASLGKTRWWRVGVGIGRPESREPDVVAKYVLGKVSARERDALEKSAAGVVNALEEIASGQK